MTVFQIASCFMAINERPDIETIAQGAWTAWHQKPDSDFYALFQREISRYLTPEKMVAIREREWYTEQNKSFAITYTFF